MNVRTTVFAVSLLIAFFGASRTLRGDMIVLDDGREYEGVLVEATPDIVRFDQDDNGIVEYPRTQVVHIRLQQLRQWSDCQQLQQIRDDVLQEACARQVDPRQYPGAGTIVLAEHTEVILRTPKTWTVTTRTITRVLGEHGDNATVREFYYRPGYERVQVQHGLSIRPDGTVVHLRDTALQDEALYARYPRYDKVRRKRLALPEGRPGTVLSIATELVRHKPVDNDVFMAEHLFGSDDPLGPVTVEVVVPEGVPLQWQILNDPENTVHHDTVKTTALPGIRHRWTRPHAPQLLTEPRMPPWQDIVPRLVVSADSRSWQELAVQLSEDMLQLQVEYPNCPPAPGKTIAEAWTAASRGIHEFPIDVSAGRVPGDPSETWHARGGSPLDRTYVLYRWLLALGNENVHWAWIRPRYQGRLADKPVNLTAFSVPAVYVARDPPLLLIPGDELARAEEKASDYAGAACLVAGIGLETVPVPPPASRGTDHHVTVNLDRNGNASVIETVTYRGRSARALRAWRRLTTEEITNNIAQIVRNRDSQAREVEYKLQTDVNLNDPVAVLRMTYSVPRFADSRKTLCCLQLPWFEYEARSVGRQNRRFPMFFDTPLRTTVTVDIRCPEQFSLYAGPEPVTCGDDDIRIETQRSDSDQNVVFRLEYERTAMQLAAERYPSIKQCLETRATIGRQYWVWEKR